MKQGNKADINYLADIWDRKEMRCCDSKEDPRDWRDKQSQAGQGLSAQGESGYDSY